MLDNHGHTVAILTDTVVRGPSMRAMGATLAGLRRERGLSQTQAAMPLGVTRGSVQLWEDAYRPPRLLALAAYARLLQHKIAAVSPP